MQTKTLLITLALLAVVQSRGNIFNRSVVSNHQAATNYTNQSQNGTYAGGWKKANVTTFSNSNNNIVQESIDAVEQKYNPEIEGYEFLKVVSVDTQLVNGMNYDIVLQFQNQDQQNLFYKVIIYQTLGNKPNQVVAVRQIELNNVNVVKNRPVQNGGWQNVSVASFAQSNTNVLVEAVSAVNTQYNPQENGYTFQKVVSVSQQVVAGMNYNVVLQYSNSADQTIDYDVVIYDCPWKQINQISSVNQISSSNSTQTTQ